MVVKVAHLELVENMSADEFRLRLCRFMTCCGVLQRKISDNAKHFKAAKQMLSKAKCQVSDCVDDYLSKQEMRWEALVEIMQLCTKNPYQLWKCCNLISTAPIIYLLSNFSKIGFHQKAQGLYKWCFPGYKNRQQYS